MSYEDEVFSLQGALAAEREEDARVRLQQELVRRQQEETAKQQAEEAKAKLLQVASILVEQSVPVSDLTTPAEWGTEKRIATGWPIMRTRGPAIQDNDNVQYIIGVTMHGLLFTSTEHWARADKRVGYARFLGKPQIEVRVPELYGFKMGVLSLIEHGEIYQDHSRDYFQLHQQYPR